jgi:hypothetical protein
MKKCTKCKSKKLLECYYYNKNENRHNSWCKECVYESQKKRWIDRKKKAINMLGGKCCKCGYNANYAAFDFHHLDPSKKEFDWKNLRYRSWKNIVVELKKCVLVCRNCHAELHNPEAVLNFENLSDNNLLNVKEIEATGNCPECKVEVYGTVYCSRTCVYHSRRKVKRPSKENKN